MKSQTSQIKKAIDIFWKRISVLYWLILGIVILIMVGIIWWSWDITSKIDDIKPIEIPKHTDIEPIDISDWKTYQNKEYGFEFKYPNNFQIDSSNSKNIYIGADMIHRRPNGVFVEIINKSIKEEINDLKSRDELTQVLEEKEVIINNVKAIKLVLTAAIGYNDFYYLFSKNNINFKLTGIQDEKYHDQIFLTFKFIE